MQLMAMRPPGEMNRSGSCVGTEVEVQTPFLVGGIAGDSGVATVDK